jgi:hypothetical protein
LKERWFFSLSVGTHLNPEKAKRVHGSDTRRWMPNPARFGRKLRKPNPEEELRNCNQWPKFDTVFIEI